MELSVVDFFSGCGGTSLGLRDAGMSIVAGIDNDPEASETYRRNFPEAIFLERDIASVTLDDIREVTRGKENLVFSGCAPCQPFSKQNRSNKAADPRRFLLAEFQRFVVGLLPDFVIVENVPGLQKVGKEGPFSDFVEALESSGYTVECQILAALDYGVPQIRKRLVLLAAKGIHPLMPAPTNRDRPSTVREWISGLSPLLAGGTDPHDQDHAAMSLSDLNLRRIMATAEGKGRESWPEELLLDCHKGHSGHSDVYGRLAWDRPASAMTTRCLSYSNGRFGHPSEDRAISLREAACLQTFPRDFRFSGTLTSRAQQVGNAVPPLLARRIGESIIEAARLQKV